MRMRRKGRFEFKVAQTEDEVEQQATLDSIQSELKVKANCRYLCEEDAELEEVFADMESDEQSELGAATNNEEASRNFQHEGRGHI